MPCCVTAVIVGAAANGLAIVVNGGYMPVWGPALTAAQMGTGDLTVGFHVLLPTEPNLQFFLMAGPIADIVPIPLGYLSNVASIGDAFMKTVIIAARDGEQSDVEWKLV